MPSVIMMIFTSVYGVVDGYFVSNFVGKTPFAAVNFIYPFIMVLGAFGFMLGTGGCALIAKTLGEGDTVKANKLFSMLVYITVIGGVVIGLAGILLLRPVASLLGAEGELLKNCVSYGRIILFVLPAFMLQIEFQSFFSLAEKPSMGLWMTVAAGVTNMALDALFVHPKLLNLGLSGAAYATAVSQLVGGIVPLIYFICKNPTVLRVGKPYFHLASFLSICTNGFSELLGNISMSLVGMLYNYQLYKFAGEDGVSAYGVLMYVNFVFLSAFIGYSVGVAPVIGFHFGADNKKELRSILKKSLVIISVSSALMLAAGEGLAYPLSVFFVGYDKGLLQLTLEGFRVFSFSFLFAGFAIFGSSFFTALNDGLTSAVMSFLRTAVFQVAAVLLLPLFFDTDGIWWSVVVAELAAASLSVVFIAVKKKKYKY
ncbi:MAG: MATE family efflux transporter [Clostridia bacterium]|nr:MATE family efflux transporter [Clostridia bacterium]